MTDKEVMQMALDAFECWQRNEDCNEPMSNILKALRTALAQPIEQEKGFDTGSKTKNEDKMNFPFLRAKERLVRIMGTFDLATGHADTFDELLDSLESELRDVLGYYRKQRVWVGLTDKDALDLLPTMAYKYDVDVEMILKFAEAIEEALKEKNNG